MYTIIVDKWFREKTSLKVKKIKKEKSTTKNTYFCCRFFLYLFYEKELNKAIKQYYIDDDIITYRGTIEKYYKNEKVGDNFEGKVFYSTSVKYEQAEVFAEDITEYSEDGSKGILLEIKVPKGKNALYRQKYELCTRWIYS